VLLALADTYVAANRTADARATLERALNTATQTDPTLVPTIRARLNELR
jgi:predicted negative regulator of RcsB-dependent stress response